MIREIQNVDFLKLCIQNLPPPDYTIEYFTPELSQLQNYSKTDQYISNRFDKPRLVGIINSENCIVLYAAYCQFYANQDNYFQFNDDINRGRLKVIASPDQKMLYFPQSLMDVLNYVEYFHLSWMQNNEEAELLVTFMEYLNNEAILSLSINGERSCKLFKIIKFIEKIELSVISESQSGQSSMSSKQSRNYSQSKLREAYFAIFDTRNQNTYDIITKFTIQKIPIEYEQKLKLIDTSKFSYSMAVWRNQNQKQILIYGVKDQVMLLKDDFMKELESIKIRKFQKERENTIINNIEFVMRKTLAENLGMLMTNEGPHQINYFYRKQIEKMFHADYDIKILQYTNALKGLFQQDPALQSLKKYNPQLYKINLKESEVLIGSSEMIEKIKHLASLRKEKEEMEKNKSNEQNKFGHKKWQQAKISNIQITMNNYLKVFQTCNSIKIIRSMPFKIDFTLLTSNKNPQIRIINHLSNYATIFLIFNFPFEILKLQTIIDDSIDLWKVYKKIESLNQTQYLTENIIETNNKLAKIYLCPGDSYGHQSMTKQVLTKYRTFKSFNTAILCSSQILQEILEKHGKQFEGSYTFATNTQIPNFKNVPILFNPKSVGSMRVEVDKDFRKKSIKSEQQNIAQIIHESRQEYAVGDYKLTEVDNYNVWTMIKQDIQSSYFVLANLNGKVQPRNNPWDKFKKSTNNRSSFIDIEANRYRKRRGMQEEEEGIKQYVYLVYQEKLVRICRNQEGQFERILTASMRDLQSHKRELKTCFERAFLLGQKYVSITMPFEHVKLTKLTEITKIKNGQVSNRNLLTYYKKSLHTSDTYKVSIFKQPQPIVNRLNIVQAEPELVNPERALSRSFTLKFDDPSLKAIIKTVNFGYGSIKKWQQNSFYCFEGDLEICEKLLELLSNHYKQIDEKKEKMEASKRQEAQADMLNRGKYLNPT